MQDSCEIISQPRSLPYTINYARLNSKNNANEEKPWSDFLVVVSWIAGKCFLATAL